MAAQIMAALQAKSAQGGQGGAPGGQPGQGPDAGDQYAQQVSELKGADPNGLARQVKAMKQICAVMLVQNLDRLPNVAGKISKIIPMFDGVLKEIQQASQVNSAVRGPINMGAAQPPSPEGPGNNMPGGGF